MAATKRDTCGILGGSVAGVPFSMHLFQGAATTPAASFSLESIKLVIANTFVAGTCNLSIFAADVAHKPTGAALATTGDITTPDQAAKGFYEFTLLAPLALDASTEYCYVLDGTLVTARSVFYIYGTNSGVFPTCHTLFSSDGVSWTLADNYDMTFELWGSDLPSPGGGGINQPAVMFESWGF